MAELDWVEQVKTSAQDLKLPRWGARFKSFTDAAVTEENGKVKWLIGADYEETGDGAEKLIADRSSCRAGKPGGQSFEWDRRQMCCTGCGKMPSQPWLAARRRTGFRW